jgi:hypothetical protein
VGLPGPKELTVRWCGGPPVVVATHPASRGTARHGCDEGMSAGYVGGCSGEARRGHGESMCTVVRWCDEGMNARRGGEDSSEHEEHGRSW